MNITSPSWKEQDAAKMLEIAQRQVERAIEELDEAIEALAAREDAVGNRAKGAASDLRKAVQTVFDERKRFANIIGTGSDDDGLDLDAARAEIRRRLARLRERGGAGGVSAESEG